MELSHFNFELPQELIAQFPAEKREQSSLLVLHRDSEKLEHRKFYNLLEYLKPKDTLVINQTKVFPARLFGTNQKNGIKSEVFLLKNLGDKIWEVLLKPKKKTPVGSIITFNQGKLSCEVLSSTNSGANLARFDYEGDIFDLLEKIGNTPLPPYIKREPDLKDKNRYQTVYARKRGAVAAPTAGLHFSPNLLGEIKGKGINIVPITLHIGWGTFKPVHVSSIDEYKMEHEYFEISKESVRKINLVRKGKGRVFAVGTSVVRVLETIAEDSNNSYKGWTNKFIYPPYYFKMVDGLITNFHLPRSTLFLLVCAFAGKEIILRAYEEAIRRKYRFYSYGDAMLIL